MRLAVGWFSLAAIFLTIVIQEFIPPLRFLHGARVFLVPMLFATERCRCRFGQCCSWRFYTGFLTDLAHLNVVNGHVEIALGWSIVVFVFFGSSLTAFSPLSFAGAGVHVLLSLVCTCVFRPCSS